MRFIDKMRGGAELPARAGIRHVALSWLGGFFAIAAVAYLTQVTHVALVLGSFGASCVLVFGFPESPFSQPRNVILGHFISSLAGLIFLALFGTTWWSMALALATSIAAMQLTRTVHPPAGSNPVIVMLTAPSWSFLLFPTLLGSIVLVAAAVIYNNLAPGRCYPKYWFNWREV